MKHKFSYVFLLLIVVVGFSLIYYFSQEKDCMFTVRNYLSGKTTIISRGKDCKELKGILDKTKSNTPLQISDDIYGTKYVIEANTNNTKAYYMPLGNILHVHVVENNKDNKILLDEWYPLEEKDYDRIEEIIQSNYYFSQEKDCMFTVRNYVSGETTIISRDKDCKELKGILDKTKSNTPLQISDDIYGTKYVIEANTNNTKAYYMPLGNILHVHVVEKSKDNKILLDEWYPLEEKDYDRIEEIIQSNLRSEKPSSNF